MSSVLSQGRDQPLEGNSCFLYQRKENGRRNCCSIATADYYVFFQNANEVYQSEVTGPTAEFLFKRGSNSSVKVGYKKLKTKEWNVTISPDHDKVTLLSP